MATLVDRHDRRLREHQPALPSAAGFQRGVTFILSLVGVSGAGLITLYLLALLNLPPHQRAGLAIGLAVLCAVVTPLFHWIQARMIAPIQSALSALHADRASSSEIEAGFARAVDLPRRFLLVQLLNFECCAALLAGWMWVRFDDFAPRSAWLLLVASGSGGLVSTLFQSFALKRFLEPVRNGLAERISDANRRSQLVRPVPLVRKLALVCMTTGVVPALFASLLAQSDAQRSLDAACFTWQRSALERAVRAFQASGDAGLAEVESELQRLALPGRVVRLSTNGEASADTPGEALADPALAAYLSSASQIQNLSLAERVVSLGAIPGSDEWIAISTSRSDLAAGSGSPIRALLLLLGCAAVAGSAAWFLGQDQARTAQALAARVEQMALGDLRPSAPVESEDELGQLSRAFALMSEALRGAVVSVSAVADGIEATASELDGVSRSLVAATSAQGRSVAEASQGMTTVTGRNSEIAAASDSLQELAASSSASILEIAAASEQMGDALALLAQQVRSVDNEISGLASGVDAVRDQSQDLASISEETAAHLRSMTDAMRVADETAEEAAAFSAMVVTSSNVGAEKVKATEAGIAAIRDASQGVERVIRGLGDRSHAMAAVLDVISSVADETNLLALNAAIISAQAGERGRGFAIVAAEIKALANRVLSHTEEISGIVRGLQDESSAAVGAVERGSQEVRGGVELAQHAASALEQITRAAAESRGRIQEIAAAVQQQAKAAEHVVPWMERVRASADTLREAAGSQSTGHRLIRQASQEMLVSSEQVKRSTEAQGAESRRVRESAEGVRSAAEAIREVLKAQREACEEIAQRLAQASQVATTYNEASARMQRTMWELSEQATALRRDVQRFQLV